ncbi:MAG: CatB-related O-acetyltransferase [Alloprevotella sp.]
MFPIGRFIKGMVKNFFNPKISNLSFVSANNHIDPRAVIYRMVKMKSSSIGRYSYVGNDTDVEYADIRQFCSISAHCRIGMGGHTLSHISSCPLFTQKINGCQEQWVEYDIRAVEEKRAVLGNDVWVGNHGLINWGVTVGHGAVIGAGAVVVKDEPPYAIVGGVPAKVIRYRFSPEVIEKLLEFQWWNLNDEFLIKHIAFFQKENISESDIKRMIVLINNEENLQQVDYVDSQLESKTWWVNRQIVLVVYHVQFSNNWRIAS